MTRHNWILSLMLMMALLLPMQAGFADEPLDAPTLPVVQADPADTNGLQEAIAVLQTYMPDAVVDFAVRERDDRQSEWKLFFTIGGKFGLCELNGDAFQVCQVTIYELAPGGLTAAQAMASLAQQKGEVTIIDLGIDFDNGRLRYEGEALLNGRRYEFEINMNGEIIDWERD